MSIVNENKELPDFLREYPKEEILKIMQKVYIDGVHVSEFPVDKEVQYFFNSKAGGFVPPKLSADSTLAHAFHYGTGSFEGMRAYYSQYGTVLIEPWENITRLIHSYQRLNSVVEKNIIDMMLSSNQSSNSGINLNKFTPSELFEIGKKAYLENNKEMVLPLGYLPNFGNVSLRYEIPVVMGDRIVNMGMKEIDAIIKMEVFLSQLVALGGMPKKLQVILSGYIRPLLWISSEGGLKLSTYRKDGDNLIIKPSYFGVATLPWGLYLNRDDYKRGIRVVIADIERIGKDMPGDGKIAADYVNSILNSTRATLGGFDEVLATRDGKLVEGSAETLFTIKKYKDKYGRTKRVAYTPPVGDSVLPGTTRDRIIRTLRKMNIPVEYRALTLPDTLNAEAVFLVGTAAQIIHVRSISETPELFKELTEVATLRSEDDNKKQIILKPEDFKSKEHMINKGDRPKIVNDILKEYVKMVMSEGLNPIYDIDPIALSSVLNITDPNMIATNEMIEKYKRGYYRELTDNPNELRKRTIEVANMINKALIIKRSGSSDHGRKFVAV